MSRTVSQINRVEPLVRTLRHRLGEQEFRRRLWHFLPGVIAMALATVPHRETVRLPIMLGVVFFGIFVPALLAIRHQRAYQRRPGESAIPSILGYVVPVSILCLLFRSHIEIPLAVAALIAFGDGSATLVGILIQGARIPWNPEKSWAGLCAFIVMGTLMPAMVYWIAAGPQVSFPQAVLCLAPVALICSVFESLPLKLNDNITIGCGAAVLLILAQTFIVGWA